MEAKESDYIVYVDESGDANFSAIDPDYPIFVLSFSVFEKGSHAKAVVPELMQIKFDFFGHDMVVPHSHEIRKASGPFTILVNKGVREKFRGRINTLVAVCLSDSLRGRAADPPPRSVTSRPIVREPTGLPFEDAADS